MGFQGNHSLGGVWGNAPRYFCLQSVFLKGRYGNVPKGNFSQVKKVSLKIYFHPQPYCESAPDNLWINRRSFPVLWKTWTTISVICSYPHGFPNQFFFDFSGKTGVFHKLTASTTATTDRFLYLLLIHVNKGVVHNHETDMQQGFTVTIHQHCE